MKKVTVFLALLVYAQAIIAQKPTKEDACSFIMKYSDYFDVDSFELDSNNVIRFSERKDPCDCSYDPTQVILDKKNAELGNLSPNISSNCYQIIYHVFEISKLEKAEINNKKKIALNFLLPKSVVSSRSIYHPNGELIKDDSKDAEWPWGLYHGRGEKSSYTELPVKDDEMRNRLLKAFQRLCQISLEENQHEDKF